MAKKKQPRRKDALLEQAVLEGQVKYGGQRSALAQLLADTKATTKQDVEAARGGGVALSQAVSGARGPMAAGYEEAERSHREATAGLAAQLAALGSAADPYKASAVVEAGGEGRRFASSKARALSDLSSRLVDAQQGAMFAERQAREEGKAGTAKIQDQLRELQGEAGSFVTSRYGSLNEARRGRELTKRGQNLSKSNADRQFQRQVNKDRGLDYKGRPLPDDPDKKKGQKLATPEAHSKAKDQVDLAKTWIDRLGKGKMPSGTIRSMLAAGDTIVVKDANGEDQKIKLPAISKDYINAAFDLKVKGSLSPANVKALHNRRLSVKRLGYKTQPRKAARAIGESKVPRSPFG